MLEVADWKARDRQQRFTPAQMEWLEMIEERPIANLMVELEDFQYVPFEERNDGLEPIVFPMGGWN